MKAVSLITASFLIFSFQTIAQKSHYDFGSRSNGIGNSNSTLADE